MNALKIYDLVSLKDNSRMEVIQVFSETSFLATPLSGGLPTRHSSDEVVAIEASLFGEMDSSAEKFAALIQAAEDRWNKQSSVVKTKSPRKGKSAGPEINISIDF
jgi:hypothetical protein